MDSVASQNLDQGLVGYLVILEDKQGNPPTSLFCNQWKSQYNPSLKLLIDPKGVTGIYGPKETSLVINERGKIVFKYHGDNKPVIEAAIKAELEADP